MAHYAFLDENNIVTEVIVGKNEGEEGINWEQQYNFIRGQICKRTSYNTRGGIHYDPITNIPSLDQSKALRKNYASIGYTYDEVRDAFIPQKPYNSWILNESTCNWDAPVARPNDGNMYKWNEEILNWELING